LLQQFGQGSHACAGMPAVRADRGRGNADHRGELSVTVPIVVPGQDGALAGGQREPGSLAAGVPDLAHLMSCDPVQVAGRLRAWETAITAELALRSKNR
jgi:hypothetical protein